MSDDARRDELTAAVLALFNQHRVTPDEAAGLATALVCMVMPDTEDPASTVAVTLEIIAQRGHDLGLLTAHISTGMIQ